MLHDSLLPFQPDVRRGSAHRQHGVIGVRCMARKSIEPGTILNAFLENKDRIPSLIDKEAFHEICEKFHIPSEVADQVRKQLCNAGFIYTFIRNELKAVRHKPSYQEVRKELHAIEKLAQQLASKLDDISDDARAFIHSAENAVDMEMVTNWDSIETSSFGHRIYRYQTEYCSESKSYLHLPQITQAVTILHNMTRHVLAVAKSGDKGGRPRNEAMWLWVVNMHVAWTEMLGRQFTFDQVGKKPITEAGIFCWHILRLIDPNAKWSEFCTAVREKVQLSRPGRGRRPRR
jgi:hypothetical protein